MKERLLRNEPPTPSLESTRHEEEEEVELSETREDLLQGIRAMDSSIQTLKQEMSKLMSVYDTAQGEVVQGAGQPLTPDITEAGRTVLEVVSSKLHCNLH